jgi:hypothetical protein
VKHSLPRARNPFEMLQTALDEGWLPIADIPLAGEGNFTVLTYSGLIRRAFNRRAVRHYRKADSWGPARATVVAVESGNYLAAIAWRWD